MTRRRETFILVPRPGQSAKAQAALSKWIRDIDGHDGYTGAALLKESANELLSDTLVLSLDFESTDALLAFREAIRDRDNPITQDDKETEYEDQGAVMFPGQATTDLKYDIGGGMFAQLLHVHAHLVDEYSPARL